MKTLIVIPARQGSTRFPNKPLAKIGNQSLIQRVWNIAKSVSNATKIVIATDSFEILDHCRLFGGEVIMTGPCNSGTDRVAEVVTNLKDNFAVIINLQGDAVLTPPWIIEKLISVMLQDANVLFATPMVKLTGVTLRKFENLKKNGSSTGTTVVFDKQFNALYFSKLILPYYRNATSDREVFRHIGLYSYRPHILLKLSKTLPSRLEGIEGLEQLRAIENQIPIRMVEVDLQNRSFASVDNPEDIEIVETIIKNEGELVKT